MNAANYLLISLKEDTPMLRIATLLACVLLVVGDISWLLTWPGDQISRRLLTLLGTNIFASVLAILGMLISARRVRLPLTGVALTLMIATGLGFFIVFLFYCGAALAIGQWADERNHARLTMGMYFPLLGFGSILCSGLLVPYLRSHNRPDTTVN